MKHTPSIRINPIIGLANLLLCDHAMVPSRGMLPRMQTHDSSKHVFTQWMFFISIGVNSIVGVEKLCCGFPMLTNINGIIKDIHVHLHSLHHFELVAMIREDQIRTQTKNLHPCPYGLKLVIKYICALICYFFSTVRRDQMPIFPRLY